MYKNKIESIYQENQFPKIFSWWALLTFLISFKEYSGNGFLSSYSSLPCFPNFQNCKEIFNFFDLVPPPYSYLESFFFTILFTIITLSGYYLFQKKFFKAYLLLWPLYLTKLSIVLLNYGQGNFDYYDLVIILVFLIYPARTDLLKLTFVILYFLASTIKIHEGWILGTYFSTLYYGLPFIPFLLIPIATNIAIIMQIVGSWFLLSKNKAVALYTTYFFIFFHLYSTVIVGYRYPITTLFSLLIIFLSEKKNEVNNFTLQKNTIGFYIFLILLFIGQSVAYIIPGDQKLTLEGNNYGLYMFEANHQCVSTLMFLNGENKTYAEYDARNRCDPYKYLMSLQKSYCGTELPLTVRWTFDHSINGEPFKRIIDEPDLCALHYKSFEHNSWIKTEKESSTVAKAYRNLYLSKDQGSPSVVRSGDYMYAPILSKSSPVTKTVLQNFLEKYIYEIKLFYWTVWFGCLGFSIIHLICLTQDNDHRKKKE